MAATARTVVDDRRGARSRSISNPVTRWIAYAVLGTFAGIMAAGLWGGIPLKEVSVVAAIAGLIGSFVGYVAANAQTVINFIFGGSLG